MLLNMGSHANNKLAVVFSIVLLAMSGLTACNSGSSSSDLFGNTSDAMSTTNLNMAQTKGTFNGCVSGIGIDKSRIQINFEFAPGASIANVYRNGNTTAIYTTAVPSNTQYIDTDLNEGQTYTYHCESIVGGLPVQGTNVLNVSTLAPDAPTFTGVSAVTNVSTHSLTVSWLPTSTAGVPATYFQVFVRQVANVTATGPQVDTTAGAIWTGTPKAHISVGTYQTQISGLGDQVVYAVGVLACSSSDVCDPGSSTNNKIITVQMSDDGLPPSTPGITTCSGAPTMQAMIVAGNVQLCAPYDSSMGAVKTRAVWASHDTASDGSFGAFSDIVNGGTKYYNFTASGTDYTQTPTVMGLSLSGLPLLQGTNYKFYVIDTDPSGHSTAPTAPVTIHIGDTTPPTWTSGGVTVVPGGSGTGDTSGNALTVSWNLAKTEAVSGDDGTFKYNIYLTLAAPANPYTAAASTIAAPADPCASDTVTDVPAKTVLQSSLTGTVGTQVHAVIDGLSGILERTKYSVCVKALDSAGNKTKPSVSASATTTTPDVTPPAFTTSDNAPSMAYSDSCYGGAPGINVAFNKSTSLDMYQYKFKLSTHSDGSSSKSLTALLAGDAHLTLNGSRYTYCFPVSLATGSNLIINNQDTIYAVIDACDNAGTMGYGTSNCTANTSISQQLGNITPPSGFTGISCATAGTAPACNGSTAAVDGTALVSWSLPGSVTGWAGFTVYSIPSPIGWTGTAQALLDAKLAFPNGTTTFDCSCTGTGASPCSSTTSCLITGLEKRRTYYFYAQVYDNSTPTPLTSGLTLQNSPTAQYKSTRTADTSAPILGGNFGLTTTTTLSGAVQPVLSWAAGADEQSLSEPGLPLPVISYVVYRKTTSMTTPVDFISLTSPSTSETGVTSFTPTTTLSYTDLTASVGHTYYYTMCAHDANTNTACTGTSLGYTPTDTDHPTVDFYFAKSNYKTWILHWTTSDPTDGGTPGVTVYRKVSTTGTTGIDGSGNPIFGNYDAPTTSDTAITTTSGNGQFPSSGSESGVTLVPSGSQYVNYLIHATNPNNPSLYTESRVSVWVKNEAVSLPTLSSVDLSPNGTITPTVTGNYTNGTINALSATFHGSCGVSDNHPELNNSHTDAYTHTTTVFPSATVSGSSGASIVSQSCDTSGNLTFTVHYLPGNTPATGVPSVITAGRQLTWSAIGGTDQPAWSPGNITRITNSSSTVTAVSGSYPRAITVATNDNLGNTSSPVTLVNLTNTFTCPLKAGWEPSQAWVGVPGDSSTKDFCLAKYTAKAIYGNGGNAGTSLFGTVPNYGLAANAWVDSMVSGYSYAIHPEFRPGFAPWNSAGAAGGLYYAVSQILSGNDYLFYGSAKALCSGMGTNYHLVKNSEWQTVAKNMESQGLNWNGLTPNKMWTGCSSGATYNCTPSSTVVRQMVLSNGEIVFDLAGDAAEYVMPNDDGSLLDMSLTSPLSILAHRSSEWVLFKVFGAVAACT